MTKEQFKYLPDKIRYKIGKNYVRYQKISSIYKAFDILLSASYNPEFKDLLPANTLAIRKSIIEFKTHLTNSSKTFHVCTGCYQIFRKRSPSTKQHKNLVGTCQICNQYVTYSSSKYIYKIRTPFTLLEAQQYARTEYPENFI